MATFRLWLPLIIALVFNAAANVLMKIGARGGADGGTLLEKGMHFFNAVTIVAIILFGINVLFYRKALEGIPLSVGYPIMLSGSLLLAVLAARFLPMLQERISPLQVAGMVLIVIGVWLVTQQPQNAGQRTAPSAIVQPAEHHTHPGGTSHE
ncbi:MAG: DMT family transporter [Armatimonadota bacterium]